MYINRIYVDRVALAWSLADSARQPRNTPATLSRRRLRRAESTRGNPLMQLVRSLVACGQSFSNSR
jgi:hypothetical protein